MQNRVEQNFARASYSTVAAIALFLTLSMNGRASVIVPESGPDVSRYTTLWTNSPFVTATEEAPAETPDYLLTGVAELEGVSYASLIDQKNKSHILLASDKPMANLKLISISRNRSMITAVVDQGGRRITVQLQESSGFVAAQAANSAAASAPGNAANAMTNAASVKTTAGASKADISIPMPGANQQTPSIFSMAPRGGSVPVAYMMAGSGAASLTADQQAGVQQIEDTFQQAVSQTGGDTSSSQYRKTWATAQELADEQLKALIGAQAYNQSLLQQIISH